MSVILLLLIVVIGIIAVAAVGPLFARRMSVRVNLIIAGGYLAVLLLLSAVCTLIPASALKAELEPVTTSGIFNDAARTVGAVINAGSFDAPEGITQAHDTLSAPLGAVELSVAPNLSGAVYIGTKGTDVPDDGRNTIDVYGYACGHVVFSDTYYDIPVEPPSAALENGTLSVNPAEEKTVDLFRFDDRNTLPQFLGTDGAAYGGGTYALQLVVVLLPPGVGYSGDGALPLSELTKPPEF